MRSRAEGGWEGGRPSWGALARPRALTGWEEEPGLDFLQHSDSPSGAEAGVRAWAADPRPWRPTGLVAEGQRWNFRVCLLWRGNGPEVTGLIGWGPLDPGPRLLLLRFIFAIWAFCKRCGKLTPTLVHP